MGQAQGRAGQLAYSQAGRPLTIRLAGLVLVSAALAASLTLAAPAGAAVGDLDWQGCITGLKSGPGASGTGACVETPEAVDGGSGLANSGTVAVSPDGKSVYAASNGNGSVATLSRNPDGSLGWKHCATGGQDGTGSNGTAECSDIPSATPTGSGSGLYGPTLMTVSPDGKSVYVVTSGDGVASFKRSSTGTLTWQGCITGDQGGAGTAGTGACEDSDGATANGSGSGLSNLNGVAVSPDGESVYTFSVSDTAITTFDRAADGSLTDDGCITGEKASAGSTGTGACEDSDGATANGAGSGLAGGFAVEVSPDDESVYVAASGDDAAAGFERAADGSLTWQGCITGNKGGAGSTGTGACEDSGGATANGAGSGLHAPLSLTISPDGGSVYLPALLDAAVAGFDRAADGTLTWQGCITGNKGGAGSTGTGACDDSASATASGAGSGFNGPYGVLASPDGRSVYLAAREDQALTSFDRAADGNLTYDGCITGSTVIGGSAGTGACSDSPEATQSGFGSGLGYPVALAASPDGESVYAALFLDSGVASFSREPATPETSLTAGPSGTTSDSTPTFSFSSDTPGSTFECEVDVGAFFDCTSAFTTYALADGPHRFRVRAVDEFGHADPIPASRDFTVDTSPTPPPPSGPAADTTPPETKLTSDPGAKVKTKKKKAKIEFGFESSEPGSTFLCSLDGGKEFGCDSPYKAKVKAKKKAKKHTFEVAAVDAAGNADSSPEEWSGKVKRKKKH